MTVWQEKLQSPNNDVLIETYNILTDGKGHSHKMPTIAEFMSIYKEREKAFIRNQDISITNEFPHTVSDKEYSKVRVREIIDLLKGKSQGKITTNLCDQPHEFDTPILKGRITRDARGRDYCFYYEHPLNER